MGHRGRSGRARLGCRRSRATHVWASSQRRVTDVAEDVRLLLDTSVLGWICHPRRHVEVRLWFSTAVRVHEVFVSEIADYELRRELLRIGARHSLARLDELGRELRYIPVTTSTWRAPARLWATERQTGRPTAGREALY